MNDSDILIDYLAVLAVIQPARIQDIEMYAPQILPHDHSQFDVTSGLYRAAHDAARNQKLVITVRRGTYFLSPTGREAVRRSALFKEVDNMRLFLMKAQRKRYK